MTEEELQAIEARAEAATSGPWEAHEERYQFGSPRAAAVRRTPCNGPDDYVLFHADELSKADADFIASSRQDVPALVAEVRRLRGLCDEAVREWDDDAEGLVSGSLIDRMRRGKP